MSLVVARESTSFSISNFGGIAKTPVRDDIAAVFRVRRVPSPRRGSLMWENAFPTSPQRAQLGLERAPVYH